MGTKANENRKKKYATHPLTAKANKRQRLLKRIKCHPNDAQAKSALKVLL